MKSPERLREYGGPMSPPAWGAWIEMILASRRGQKATVAPRMGGVD